MLVGFLILLVVSIVTTMYLIIVGANKCNTEYEKNLEDELQMEYLKKWRKKHESK